MKLTLEDQVPISKDDDIRIKLLDSSDGTQTEDTGKISWLLNIEPGKSIEKKLIFSVRHPKNKRIINLTD
jgi:hypothetical protein